MEQFATKILITVALAYSCAAVCVEYGKGECLVCEPQQRLSNGRCYDYVVGCLLYDRGKNCMLCVGHVSPLANNSCPSAQSKFVFQQASSNKSVTLYTLAYGQSETTNYLDPLNCKQDPLLMRCDSFLRTGQYAHFISKTSMPWQSISFQIRGAFKTYRIIYFGAGGGIILCIIRIDSTTYAVVLQSLVTIAATDLISNCLDYTVDRKCRRCQPNFHLQQNFCHPKIAGCVSYFKKICLQCEGWGLLVQNRCIYDCSNECDTGHILFLGNQIHY